jgi:hypothetical protein
VEDRLRVSDQERDRAAQTLREHFATRAIVPFAVCTVIWLASGAHGQFWPIWVALVTVIALLRGGWGGGSTASRRTL